MKLKHIQHLYWRAGFGTSPIQLQELSKLDKPQIVDDLFRASKSFSSLNIDTTELDMFPPQKGLKDAKKQRLFIAKSVDLIKSYNLEWLNRLYQPRELLREKMTLFWANHFACFDNNVVHVQQFNNTLREYALGDFKSFVKAVSKDAAMIKYLNAKQNRKKSPNENFARELMELFTLGVGHYSEEDVKECARAFTGYNHNFDGSFNFNNRQHDSEFKSFFGRRGRYDGDDIIDIILEEKQCAIFISEKIYSYFVNENINPEHIALMADQFYSNYDIEALMRFVFESDWFYEQQNIGSKIKSPIELLIGIQKVAPFTFENPRDILKIQKSLGQFLLHPPNVAGWRGGQNWIDSNTIMFRLKLPSILLNNAFISTKEEDGINDKLRERFYKRKGNKKLRINETNWNVFNENYKTVSIKELNKYLLLCTLNKGTKNYLKDLSLTSKKEHVVQIMSLPEYQMC